MEKVFVIYWCHIAKALQLLGSLGTSKHCRDILSTPYAGFNCLFCWMAGGKDGEVEYDIRNQALFYFLYLSLHCSHSQE